ncbi:RHS repeat-associated core domain-containing protein [Achromobacter seleniivolatilans]|uniref:RHS repeat-associated core domain-containing protein n=1 Tax=Achromobacter seleniivolatilans TaxID=3047478 RepID=A0ABY9LZM3_9BURK|nr:RHS repeat-associated core domain-containing protein [Achromobacter sp. R39]WMD20197.1 RHS repeat-associated core domain-containing protein [Achromobacter sp. R39]
MKATISALALSVLSAFSSPASAASTTKYNYTAGGLLASVDGPRLDVTDVTTFEYDASGNISSVTDAIGQRTQYSNYNKFGLPELVTEPHGRTATLSYTEEGWLATVNWAGKIRRHEYNASGDLTKTTYPGGSWVQYLYDPARRLVGQDDSSGKRIRFALDSMGNRVQSTILNVAGTAAEASTTTKFDELGRAISEMDRNGRVTKFEYDVVGNLVSTTSPKGHKTQFTYDALNRRITSTDALGGLTRYEYNAADQITKVVDAKGSQTTYVYDYNANLTKLVSADTGTTTRTFDEAANLIKSVDARGVTTEFVYDELNRLFQKKYPASPSENMMFGYYTQSGSNIGQLAVTSGNYGTTGYEYDHYSDLRVEWYKPENQATTYSKQYTYNGNNQLLSEQTSDLKISYERNAAGDVTAIKVDINGTSQYIAQGITYRGAGRVDSMQLGNGTSTQNYYDKNLRLEGQRTGTATVASSVDANGNVVSITGSSLGIGNTSYKYDALDRLIEERTGNILKSYAWDSVGNRTQRLTKNASTGNLIDTQTLGYSPNSNLLTSINGAPVASDTAGNLLQGKGQRYTYDSAGRLNAVYSAANVKIAEFKYNHLGQRIEKRVLTNSIPEITYYEYGQQGQLTTLRKVDTTGKKLGHSTWVWFDGRPLAQINFKYDASGTAKTHILYLQNDHLDTPRRALGDNGSAMWRWTSDAFGIGDPDNAIGIDSAGNIVTDVPLRFPGQIADQQTALHYNYFRDYDPDTGRYIQSDPVGLVGGINTYGYAYGNPLKYVDPDGRYAFLIPLFAATIRITATDLLIGGSIGTGAYGANVIYNNAKNPPTGSIPINESPWSGDHGRIKNDLHLGGTDKVYIDPDGNVWPQHPDGSWSNEGPASSYTGSGKPSGRRGKDRDKRGCD